MGNSEYFKVEIDRLQGLQKRIEKLDGAGEKAVKRLVSDFKTRAPSWVSSAVTDVYGIKKSDIKSALKIRKSRDGSTATLGGVTIDNIELVYSGRPLTLTHFSQKPTAVPTRRATKPRLIPGENIKSENRVGKVAIVNPIAPYQVTATIYKGQREKFEGAFVAKGNGGVVLAFQKTEDDRIPIEVIKRTSIPQMITNPKVEPDIYERIDKGLQTRLEHHLEQALKDV